VEPAVLADDTHMLRQTITVVLNDLEERGYLFRDSHKTDRRRKVIRLTPEGQVFAQTVLSAISNAEQEAASVLSFDEQQRLLDYSQRFSQEFARKVNDITLRKS
ncbi:MAG: winged helix DNA-binding protein, partial [Victivallales bacterium]|nr:winged helix DNA-binding protein [Victivallales bacterium]